MGAVERFVNRLLDHMAHRIDVNRVVEYARSVDPLAMKVAVSTVVKRLESMNADTAEMIASLIDYSWSALSSEPIEKLVAISSLAVMVAGAPLPIAEGVAITKLPITTWIVAMPILAAVCRKPWMPIRELPRIVEETCRRYDVDPYVAAAVSACIVTAAAVSVLERSDYLDPPPPYLLLVEARRRPHLVEQLLDTLFSAAILVKTKGSNMIHM